MKYTHIISLAVISIFFVFTPTKSSMRRSDAPVTKQDHAMSKLNAKTGMNNVTVQDIEDFNEEMNPQPELIKEKKTKSKSKLSLKKKSSKK